MTTSIRVTVPGEPVSAEVTWEQVRAYLVRSEAPNWLQRLAADHDDRGIRWLITEHVSPIERRHPAAVLRNIASVEQEPDKRAPVDETRARGAIGFLREAFCDDGAEGESVHLVCRELERLLVERAEHVKNDADRSKPVKFFEGDYHQ